MTLSASDADPGASPSGQLLPRVSGDGSFSLFCRRTGEAFHSAQGALQEAMRVFVAPADLGRFQPGSILRVVEVAVGTGTNTAALLQAAADCGLQLDWWGLELDPEPLRLALADPDFRLQWRPGICERLQELSAGGRLCWGDARRQLPWLQGSAEGEALVGRCDLVLLDAFSPRRCPQLWSEEFLGALARLLAPEGRLLTYCSAAAVRRALQLAGLQLAAIEAGDGAALWSAGTAASPSALPAVTPLRPLSPMEREHIASRAGEPYRDPAGDGTVQQLLLERAGRQSRSAAEPASHWQRRWGASRRHSPPTCGPNGPVGWGEREGGAR